MPGFRQNTQAHPSAQAAMLSRAALKSHAVIPPRRFKASPVKRPKVKKAEAVKTETSKPEGSNGTFDLLGSIMSSQNVLALRSNDITINRDGEIKFAVLS